MSDETKTCPYCAETIKAAAIVCRYCGRDLEPETIAKQAVNQQPATQQPVAPQQEVVIQADKKSPAIGFFGLLVLVVGAIWCGATGGDLPGAAVTILGAAILGYALVTGNIKLFG